ncbi:MAG TPA: CaiB/BaiF CoA-transferase family protein [Ilumatobacter sp.]|nr:CaiB/BaiF CoA-transferase family protein [Ilumatobacter sp.]
MSVSPGPLAGIRVIDVTTTVLGPYCTYLLGCLGAEVIKIESPGGDIARAMRGAGEQRTYLLNRGKRSVVLDLKQPSAVEALAALVATSDVFMHNLRASAASRLGIDYEQVSGWNPSVIYCAATGFGEGGRYENLPAYDDIIQAVSGLAYLQRDDEGSPRYMNTVIADKTAGMSAVSGILAALYHRERTGVGQMVNISMFESLAAFVLVEHLQGMAVEPPSGPPGYTRVMSPHRRPYRTLDDRFVAVLPYTDAHWARACHLLGRPDLIDDPELGRARERVRHVDRVYEVLAAYCASRTADDVVAEMRGTDIPCVEVNSLDDLLDDPHLHDVGFYDVTPADTMRHIESVPRFSATPTEHPQPGAILGEDSVAILREVGLAQEAIDAMIASGATVADGNDDR